MNKKLIFPCFMYHESKCPKGHLFKSKEELESAGEGWVDTPAGFKKELTSVEDSNSKELELIKEEKDALLENVSQLEEENKKLKEELSSFKSSNSIDLELLDVKLLKEILQSKFSVEESKLKSLKKKDLIEMILELKGK